MTPLITFHHILKTLNYIQKIKCFVQVGSHDGVMHDPLREFILKNNWRGILIEPQIEMLEKCKNNYHNKENLAFVNVAVHPIKSQITLYIAENPKDYSHTGWASINSDRFLNTIYKNSITKLRVQAVPLMQVIKDNKFESVDLLQIDTEGFDAEVIKMFDFDTYHPSLVQYEHIHLPNNIRESIHKHLSSYGYFVIVKKNDTFAIIKDNVTIWFILVYIYFRMYSSITSHFRNMVQKI